MLSRLGSEVRRVNKVQKQISIIHKTITHSVGKVLTEIKKKKVVIIIAGNVLVEIVLTGKLLATSLSGKVLSIDFVVGYKTWLVPRVFIVFVSRPDTLCEFDRSTLLRSSASLTIHLTQVLFSLCQSLIIQRIVANQLSWKTVGLLRGRYHAGCAGIKPFRAQFRRSRIATGR